VFDVNLKYVYTVLKATRRGSGVRHALGHPPPGHR
jgi:hypothetical protein